MAAPRSKLGILLSGRGSNFLAIAESIDSGRLAGAEIAVVLSNRAEASCCWILANSTSWPQRRRWRSPSWKPPK